MLKNFVKGIADAIRRKEGSSDLISPMDFAQRIDNLQVGGGTDGGVRSSWRYFDVSNSPMQPQAGMLLPTIVKLLGATNFSYILGVSSEDLLKIGAIGVDGDGLIAQMDGVTYTWNEAMAMEGMTPEAMAQMNVIEITEDEFLNKTFE